MAKLNISTDIDAIGLNTPSGQKGENKAVNMSGAVSPAARAIANTTPVAIGVKAAGRVTLIMVTNLEAPMP
jgi:hypothetical protein